MNKIFLLFSFVLVLFFQNCSPNKLQSFSANLKTLNSNIETVNQIPEAGVNTGGAVQLPKSSNFVTTIINDMQLPNSYPIAIVSNGAIIEKPMGGYPARTAELSMGYLAHGSAAATLGFWNPSVGYEYILNQNWSEVVPWLVLLTGTNNKANNSRVEFKNFRAFYLSKKTKKWVQIGTSGLVEGYNCSAGKWDQCSDPTDVYTSGIITSLKPAVTGSNFHGWSTSGGSLPDPFDVEAYYSSVESRLIGSDTHAAQYMLHVGTDFYPSGIRVAQMGGYNPGSGYSRTKAITADWQVFNFATISVAPVVRNQYVMDVNAFILNPPPAP